MKGEEQSKKLSSRSVRPPAKTPEGRENQLVSLAMDLVERRLRDGSASAQETVHFLKLGSSREALEKKKLEADTQLRLKRVETMASAQKMEELYAKAIVAMASYSGQQPEDDEDEAL